MGDSILSLTNEGHVGINQPAPSQTLDVNGMVAMQGRMGTYKTGKVLADGKWHPVLTELNGCFAFEVVAGIGKKKTGKYALIHALALSTFGKSKHKIKVTQGYYGVRCNKIELRWTGDTYNFNLEMRTRCSYGGDYYVKYYISSLWADHFMDDSIEI